MAISRKGSYRISTAPTKIPIIFFIEIEETILKSYRGNKGPPKKQKQPSAKRTILEVSILDFKVY